MCIRDRDKVVDAAPDASAGEYDKYNDIKQGQANGNYQYDAIGNLIKDNSEKITNITWSVYGKILSITKTAQNNGDVESIYYTYDASGNRISKEVKKKNVIATDITWYARDANGNVMSVYTCLLYTSDAADERSSVDLGGRRIIK